MEAFVIKVFLMGKIQANMYIAVFGGITLSLKMEYAAEKLL